ncbi:MAG: glycosyltransferase [Candidatus Omnitrophica bacterium]|nr:glycosyltransferase [Candidatus Omnitrophota bacterium]MDD5671141.1 glycosyltransferase [Candidatus Omnitrophota bacterium]
MEAPSFSIVISTLDRATHLKNLLEALVLQSWDPFEVVIVLGPCKDNTRKLLERYRGFFKWVECPEANLSVSRNLGIVHASGDICVFIDDDSLPLDRDWLLRYANVFAGDGAKKIGAATGPVLHRDTEYYEFRNGVHNCYGFQQFTFNGDPGDFKWQLRLVGGNCAVRRREVLLAIGGFDERYLYYHDETDASIRMIKAGWEIRHVPDAVARHFKINGEFRKSDYDLRWDVIGRSDAYFAMKNGDDFFALRLLKTLLYAPRKHFVLQILHGYQHKVYGARKLLYFILLWLQGTLSGIVLACFPRKLMKGNDAGDKFLRYDKNALSKCNPVSAEILKRYAEAPNVCPTQADLLRPA